MDVSRNRVYEYISLSSKLGDVFFPKIIMLQHFPGTHTHPHKIGIFSIAICWRGLLLKLPKTQRIKRYGIWKLVAVRRILWARRNGTNWIVNWWYFYALYYHIIFGLRCGSWLFVVPNKNMEYAVIVLSGISVGRQTSSLRGWRFYWFKKIFVWINNWKIATTLLLVERVWVRHRNL